MRRFLSGRGNLSTEGIKETVAKIFNKLSDTKDEKEVVPDKVNIYDNDWAVKHEFSEGEIAIAKKYSPFFFKDGRQVTHLSHEIIADSDALLRICRELKNPVKQFMTWGVSYCNAAQKVNLDSEAAVRECMDKFEKTRPEFPTNKLKDKTFSLLGQKDKIVLVEPHRATGYVCRELKPDSFPEIKLRSLDKHTAHELNAATAHLVKAYWEIDDIISNIPYWDSLDDFDRGLDISDAFIDADNSQGVMAALISGDVGGLYGADVLFVIYNYLDEMIAAMNYYVNKSAK